MTDELPALPETEWCGLIGKARPYEPEWVSRQPGYDAEQMRDYAAAAIVAERAKWQADAERLDYITSNARCDPKLNGQHVWWPTSFNHRLTGPTLRDAIDAARKA